MLRTTSRLPLVAAAIAAATVVAACGSNSPKSTTASSSGQPTQDQIQQMQQDGTRFATCMRSHGVSSFPDPSSPREFKGALNPNSALAHSPAFQSAYTDCQHLLSRKGSGGQGDGHSQAQIAAALAFARCIRSHGFPSFPDPTSTGELTHEMLANAGIDLHQPGVVQAADACVGVTHGFITRAVVARFIAGH